MKQRRRGSQICSGMGALVLLVAALLVATLACGGGEEPVRVGTVDTAGDGDTSQAASAGQETYQVGDVISTGDMLVVLLGWSEPSPNDFIQPEEGYRFIVVDVLVVNQGAQPRTLASGLQMKLKDSTGQQYSEDLAASIAAAGTSPGGEISPGERLRGQVAYQVREDAEGLVFVFDANLWSAGKIFIELGTEPVQLEPPEHLEGETAQTTFAVGDGIASGEQLFVVNEARFSSGSEFNHPDDGMQYLIVDISVTNQSEHSLHFNSLLQLTVRDGSGQVYPVHLGASIAAGGDSPDGELVQGETVRGQIGFQVPDTDHSFTLVIDSEVWGFGKFFVSVP